jgi:hypothetical protein
VGTAPDVPGLDMQNIVVSWDAPFNGGVEITRYTIKFRHVDGTLFSEETSQCSGLDADIIANNQCTVQIGILTNAPFDLTWGSEIVVSISATNRIGESLYTEGGGAFIVSRPDRPIFVSNLPETTDSTQIGITWQQGVSDGGEPVIDYKIMYALEGASTFTMLVEDVTETQYITQAVQAKETYQLKVQARNQFGFSFDSETIKITAATAPKAPIEVEIDPAESTMDFIKLKWKPGPTTVDDYEVIDYAIFYDNGQGGNLIEYISNVRTQYTTFSIDPSLTYVFGVKARNEVGYSAMSDTFSINVNDLVNDRKVFCV